MAMDAFNVSITADGGKAIAGFHDLPKDNWQQQKQQVHVKASSNVCFSKRMVLPNVLGPAPLLISSSPEFSERTQFSELEGSGGLKAFDIGEGSGRVPQSGDELAERLEKSEAGRKKLRQAISILQEKLDAMEKVLKVNDILRQECEQERQRAESEKQRAEEEKRLKTLLEKDSATFKDQMSKILQRLGAVENKQKADKKEIERLRNEVKLSAEGMRVASQAVNAVQSSFQTLETNLIEKVNGAFEEARAATQALKHMQGSLQSMQQVVAKQGSSLNNGPELPPAGHASEKLIDEISRLFNKERQSHCKIEHRLSMLKSAIKVGRRHISAENIVDFESLALSKKKRDKSSEKRKSRGEEDVFDRRVRKRNELFDVPAVNSVVNRLAFIGQKQADKDQSLSSLHSIEHQRTSDDVGSLPIEQPIEQPYSYNTASNDYNEGVVVDHRGSSKGNAHEQMPPKEAIVATEKENLKDAMVQIVNRDDCEKVEMQNKDSTELHDGGDHGVSHARRNEKLAYQEKEPERGFSACRDIANVSIDVVHFNDVNGPTNPDPDVDTSDDSEEWWWSNDRVLLSPSLPEIPSPVPSREPSRCLEFFDSVMDPSVSCKVLVKDASVVCEAANLQGNPDSTKASNNLLCADVARTSSDIHEPPGRFSQFEKRSSATELDSNTSTELGGKVLVQTVQATQDASMIIPETGNDVESHNIGNTLHKVYPSSDRLSMGNDINSGVASHDTCPCADPVSKTMFGHESSAVLDNVDLTQFEDYTLEAVGNAPLADINEFLDLLPLPDNLPGKFCESDPPLSVPREAVQSTCLADKSNQLQAACERQLSKAIEKKFYEETGEKLTSCTNVEHVVDPISEGLSTQVSCDFEGTRDKETSSVTATSRCFTAQGTLLPSTTEPASPSEASSLSTVFLLPAFKIEDVDSKIDLTAACIIVNNLENHLVHMKAEKGEMQLQEVKLYKTSTELPLVYMACSIISSAVVLVRSEKGGVEPSAAAMPMYALLQAYVTFIRNMFKERASIMLNTILAQLSRFVIQGEAMLVTLKGTITPCDDALGIARVIHDKKQCTYEYFEATLEDIYAGGKVLATLCQVLACVTHLQNIVYEVLGWCEKDIMWLLTVFSSFSSICGHTAFMVEADDLLGHAICAIIVELVASVEQDSGKRAKPEVSEPTTSPYDVDPNHLISWSSLNEALKVNGMFSVKQVFLAALGALQYVLGSTQDSLLSSFVRTNLHNLKDCIVNDTKQTANYECVDISYKRLMEDSCMHPEVSTVCKTIPESLLENHAGSALKTLGPHKWQRKYVEAVGAVEVIAQFMGWDWTYNHLIVKCLWKMVASGSTQICAAGVSHILSILMRIARKGGGTDLPGLADLSQRIIHLVHSASTLLGKAESVLLFDLQ